MIVLKSLVLILCFTLFFSTTGKTQPAEKPLSAMATLSSRSAKPKEHLELVVTVRSADHPSVIIPSNLTGLHFQKLRKPRLIKVDDDKVWLFRYRVTPQQTGDFEIPRLQIIDGNKATMTSEQFLHVTANGERPPLSARELAIGVSIPESLSEEVLKAAPQPTPRPTPAPTPRDTRDFAVKASSTCLKLIKAIWNYPGK